MKSIILSFFAVAVYITSFGQQTYETISINGSNREYYQYIPTGYDAQNEQLPVVFILHGLGGTAQSTSTWGWNSIADTGRYIAIYPQGLLNDYNQTAWNNNTLLASDGEDLAFISNLLDSLNSDPALNIDMSRIYMTGISMGSIMTYNVCRFMSDRIAAVVCHIGTMSDVDLANFTPEYPTPTLHMHGTEDQTVPYNSNKLLSLSLVPNTIEQLKTTNGFQGDSTITQIPDNPNDTITVDRIVYNATTPLELWRMNNADHVLLFEAINNDTNSTEVTWGFLQQFSHPNPSTAEIDEISAGSKARIYPNPVGNELHIINYFDFNKVALLNLAGETVLKAFNPSETIDVSNLNSGIYFAQFIDKNGVKSTKKLILK